MPISTSDPRAAVIAKAQKEGFDVVRIARAEAPPHAGERLRDFLADGFHGSMDWMAVHAGRRADPKMLWPQAHSIILLGVNYGQSPEAPAPHGAGTISVYARGEDYHAVLKPRLKRLAGFLCARFGGDAKVFVDTAPVLEKALAEAAGIGWQGKHTNLVSREFGSWLFLGSVFTTLALEPDAPMENHCGACRACLDICPTAAFPAPYRLDARRCISYLTIEHKGHIGREFREAIGNRIYGCDDCLAVCPWNKFARVSREAKFATRPELKAPSLADLLRLDEAAFREHFRKSPVRRIGRDRFLRNVLIAAGNSGEAGLAAPVEALLADGSPLVRAMAVWALGRLIDSRSFAALAATHGAREPDSDVRGEWNR